MNKHNNTYYNTERFKSLSLSFLSLSLSENLLKYLKNVHSRYNV